MPIPHKRSITTYNWINECPEQYAKAIGHYSDENVNKNDFEISSGFRWLFSDEVDDSAINSRK